MTDAERTMLLDLLAREGQETAPRRGKEDEPLEEERMVDFTEELEKALRQARYGEDDPEEVDPADLAQELGEALRQARDEAAAMHRDIRELRKALDKERSRRARVYGFLAGVGTCICLLPILAEAANLSWRLFRWLAGILGSSPELLAGSMALALAGMLLLRAVKPLGECLEKDDEYDEYWEEEE